MEKTVNTYTESLIIAENNAKHVGNAYAIFGKAVCNRCGGGGQYSYCQMYGSKCFGCEGKGYTLPSEGSHYYVARSQAAERKPVGLVGRIINNPSQCWTQYPAKFLWEVLEEEPVENGNIRSFYNGVEVPYTWSRITARQIFTGEVITETKASVWVRPTFAEVYEILENDMRENSPRKKAHKTAKKALEILRAYEAQKIAEYEALVAMGEEAYNATFCAA